jgi:hypothetical protein
MVMVTPCRGHYRVRDHQSRPSLVDGVYVRLAGSQAIGEHIEAFKNRRGLQLSSTYKCPAAFATVLQTFVRQDQIALRFHRRGPMWNAL